MTNSLICLRGSMTSVLIGMAIVFDRSGSFLSVIDGRPLSMAGNSERDENIEPSTDPIAVGRRRQSTCRFHA